LDLRTLSDEVLAEVEGVLNDRGIICIPNQTLSPEEQVRFSRRFGELETPVLEQYTVPNARQMIILSNIVENGVAIGLLDGGQFWHTDSTFRPKPARYTILHAIEVPFDGEKPLGDTLFVRTDRAYEKLSEEMRERLAGLKAIHSFAKNPAYSGKKDRPNTAGGARRAPLTAEQRARTPDATHPIVRTHPKTGRKCVFINEGLTVGIIGVEKDESDALVAKLCSLCTSPEEIYRHKWRVGDVVIWDNCMTQHSATANYTFPQHRRRIHRTTVEGEAPF
jgi:taurine dioxygenase